MRALTRHRGPYLLRMSLEWDEQCDANDLKIRCHWEKKKKKKQQLKFNCDAREGGEVGASEWQRMGNDLFAILADSHQNAIAWVRHYAIAWVLLRSELINTGTERRCE